MPTPCAPLHCYHAPTSSIELSLVTTLSVSQCPLCHNIPCLTLHHQVHQPTTIHPPSVSPISLNFSAPYSHHGYICYTLHLFPPQLQSCTITPSHVLTSPIFYTSYTLSYSMPQEDVTSNLQEASVSRSGGILTMQFARKRVTNDTSRDISLDQCVFLLHAWGRGVRNYAAKQYFYHSHRTFVVLRKVCFPNSTLCPPGKNQKI